MRRAPWSTAGKLAARAELGELPLERLRLAAFLGDPDARAALGERLDPTWTPFCRSHAELELWASGLPAFGPEPLLRAAFVAGERWLGLWLRHALTCVPGRQARWLAAQVRGALRAGRRRLEAGDPEPGRRALGLFTLPSYLETVCPELPPLRALHGHLLQALSARSPDGAQPRDCALRVILAADVPPPRTSASAAQRASLGRGRVRHAVRAALVPWALGGSAPRERA